MRAGKIIFIAGPQIHDPPHVNFIERRQHRGCLLGFNHALGNTGSQPSHRHPPLNAFTWNRCCRRICQARCSLRHLAFGNSNRL
jgi:hypothetical protein